MRTRTLLLSVLLMCCSYFVWVVVHEIGHVIACLLTATRFEITGLYSIRHEARTLISGLFITVNGSVFALFASHVLLLLLRHRESYYVSINALAFTSIECFYNIFGLLMPEMTDIKRIFSGLGLNLGFVVVIVVAFVLLLLIDCKCVVSRANALYGKELLANLTFVQAS